MILITKGGLSRGGDNEMPENCLYDCRLRDTCIYVPRWADEETLLRIGTERSKSCPLVQVYEVPKETEQERTVMYERKDEPQSVTYNPTSVNNIWEKPTNPYVPNEQTEPTISKMEQVDKDINVRSKDEPQKIYCPKCGSSDYIKDLEKDFGVKDNTFKYKCINCNTYIKDEPQTEREGK